MVLPRQELWLCDGAVGVDCRGFASLWQGETLAGVEEHATEERILMLGLDSVVAICLNGNHEPQEQ